MPQVTHGDNKRLSEAFRSCNSSSTTSEATCCRRAVHAQNDCLDGLISRSLTNEFGQCVTADCSGRCIAVHDLPRGYEDAYVVGPRLLWASTVNHRQVGSIIDTIVIRIVVAGSDDVDLNSRNS
jgi:hypothetical protein